MLSYRVVPEVAHYLSSGGMARVTPAPDAPAGAAAFELERFEWVAPGRIEVVGRWSAIRGRRFVRPTLTLRGDGATHRLLALLEHKPWAPVEGDAWIAAFPWEGEPLAFESADLAVATGIELELPPPGASPSEDRLFRAVPRGPVDQLPLPPEERAGRERAHALELMKERDALRAERDEAVGALRVTALELDAAATERDAAIAERDAVIAERDTVVAERDAALAERDHALAERASAREERDDAEADRDRAEIERDRARNDRPASPVPDQERLIQELAREPDAALRARDAAVGTREYEPRQVSPIRPGELRMSWFAVWAPRLIALGILVVLFIALLVLLAS